MCEVFTVSEIFEASTGPQPKICIIYKMSSENSLRCYSNASYFDRCFCRELSKQSKNLARFHESKFPVNHQSSFLDQIDVVHLKDWCTQMTDGQQTWKYIQDIHTIRISAMDISM